MFFLASHFILTPRAVQKSRCSLRGVVRDALLTAALSLPTGPQGEQGKSLDSGRGNELGLENGPQAAWAAGMGTEVYGHPF